MALYSAYHKTEENGSEVMVNVIDIKDVDQIDNSDRRVIILETKLFSFIQPR